ncbi:MAG: hypothetical protein ABUS79_09400 [Pseudomonadota bacterium]
MRRIRLECAAVILLHAALILGLGLTPSTYLLLYLLYGLNWSAQQGQGPRSSGLFGVFSMT